MKPLQQGTRSLAKNAVLLFTRIFLYVSRAELGHKNHCIVRQVVRSKRATVLELAQAVSHR